MARIYRMIAIALLANLSLVASSATAQVEATDPDVMIDGDLSGEGDAAASPASDAVVQPTAEQSPAQTAAQGAPSGESGVDGWTVEEVGATPAATGAATANAGTPSETTYRQDDLMGAAEGVFGKGSEGLASMIEDILRKQGEPNGYITGREAGGAIAVGLRYGSGTLHHKVEGNRPIYWTGPSLGFDLGLNAGKAFVLVYNLYDTEDIYHRFGAGEGQAYLVGGFHVSYLRRGDVVLIPVRMGAGLRLGANVGYMRISRKSRWLPF